MCESVIHMEADWVRLGREVTQDRNAAEAREWLIPNGIGGYASGTVAGTLTRRYHGLLVAATSPPTGRHLIVPKLEAVLTYRGVRYELGTNAWADGSVSPHGYALLESFALDGNIATWTYTLGDAIFSVRLTMQPGANVTALVYALERADEPATLDVRVLADDRDHHGTSRQDGRVFASQLVTGGVRVGLPSLRANLEVRAEAQWSTATGWYRAFALDRERERGLEAVEDHPIVASFRATVAPRQRLDVTLAFGDASEWNAPAIVAERRALDAERCRGIADAPLRVLAIAADAFVVDEDGTRWYRSGDLAAYDGEQRVYRIVGRLKELIISGGFNIYPREIENEIDLFPGIVASAVIGIADAARGELPIAYIEISEPVDTDALLARLRERLASFKVPKSVHVIDALPRNALGKIEKPKLRALLA